MDIDSYLERIGVVDTELRPSLELLSHLQAMHILHVPFENLDVMEGVPIVLEVDRLFDKIVRRRRGGFCFEQNGLFAGVLRDLGFEVRMVEASVYITREGRFGRMRNHMALIVGGTHLVDVGFGRASRYPLPLSGEVVSSVDGEFRVLEQGGHHEVQYLAEGRWHVQYRFLTPGLRLEEFQGNCDWIQSSPDSMFTQGRMVTRGTEEGRITLEESFIKVRHHGVTEEREIAPGEFEHYLHRYFRDLADRSRGQ